MAVYSAWLDIVMAGYSAWLVTMHGWLQCMAGHSEWLNTVNGWLVVTVDGWIQ